MAQTLEANGIKVLRVRASGVTINGSSASPEFSLFVSKKGELTVFPPSHMPLVAPILGADLASAQLASLSQAELAALAHKLASVMRQFENANKEQLENEWRVVSQPVLTGSYRGVFETYRQRAMEVRGEIWKRLGEPKAITFALDDDALVGASPITDAANYLDELASKLESMNAVKRP
jgi:hypothetical protein